MKIFQLSLYSMILSSFVLAIGSLIYCWKSYNPLYIKTFPIYTLVNGIENVAEFFNDSWHGPLQTAYTLFEMIYFSVFLASVTTRKKTKRLLWAFLLFFSGLFGYRWLIKKDVVQLDGLFVLIESFTLCIGCILYVREIMLEPLPIDLAKSPAFWMVMGILLYFGLMIPTIMFSSYLEYKKETELAYAIYSINNFAQVLNSVLFLKAMTCSKTK